MENLPWFWIWLILTAALCVGEMLTAGFYLLPFAIGTAAAAIASILGAPFWLQLVLLAVLSVIALIVLRPLAKRVTKDGGKAAGADRLVNSHGVVIEGGNALRNEFRVSVQLDEWNAMSTDNVMLPVGSKVVVLGIDGTHLIVRAI
jgi:membrane protein implicated in regulation of membrane protease activity